MGVVVIILVATAGGLGAGLLWALFPLRGLRR
jgi:hypothetical protein